MPNDTWVLLRSASTTFLFHPLPQKKHKNKTIIRLGSSIQQL